MMRKQVHGRRRGALLVIALVAVIVTSAVIANAVRMVLAAQAEHQRQRQRLQLEMLVVDALQVEVTRRTQNQDETETPEWKIASEDWAIPFAGAVVFETVETENETTLFARGRLETDDGKILQRLTRSYTINPSE